MHIVLAVLGSIITILILVKTLGNTGLTIDSFNPFAWYRKYQWTKKYHAKPIYSIDDPQQVAALLIVAVANADGIISLEEKQLALQIFEKDLQQTAKEATGLFTSSVFFLKEEDNVAKNMAKILKFTAKKLTPHQIEYTVECMQKIASLNSAHQDTQQKIINSFEMFFKKRSQ